MDKLLCVPDIMARYQVSAPTARKIMRKCVHMDLPKLAVTERALAQYEFEMNREPGQTKEEPKRKQRRLPMLRILHQQKYPRKHSNP